MQTTQALVNAFEKKTGIQVNVRFDDEDLLADQLVTEGTHSPADVFFTENSPPLQYLASKRLLDPVAASTLALAPSKYNSPNGLWAGVSARVSVIVYNTSLLKRASCRPRPCSWRSPSGTGKIALAGGETDFQPIVTSVARTYGTAAALRWLEAAQGQRRQPPVPRQRDGHRPGQPRARSPSASSTSTTGTGCGPRSGASNMHSAIAYFAPHDVGYVVDVSGAAVLRSSQHEAEAQRFVAFLDSVPGPARSSPTATASSTRSPRA